MKLCNKYPFVPVFHIFTLAARYCVKHDMVKKKKFQLRTACVTMFQPRFQSPLCSLVNSLTKGPLFS